MSVNDITTHFVGVNVCLERHKALGNGRWVEERKKLEFVFQHGSKSSALDSVQMYSFTVTSANAEAFIAVHQQDKRRIGTVGYFDVGLAVLKEGKQKGSSLAD